MPNARLVGKQYSNAAGKIRLVGQKPPLRPKEVWSIRVRLQISRNTRDLALFNLAIDSKLRSCDLVALRVADVSHRGQGEPFFKWVKQDLKIKTFMGTSKSAVLAQNWIALCVCLLLAFITGFNPNWTQPCNKFCA